MATSVLPTAVGPAITTRYFPECIKADERKFGEKLRGNYSGIDEK
jgi:hypothetical protein